MVRWIRVLLGTLLVLAGSVVSGGTAAAEGPGWLHTNGARIETAAGDPYQIKAVAWFGMETPNCAPHGLWQIGLDEGLAQIAGFGFTTIRLPFSNECLHSDTVTGVDARANPDLVGLRPQQLMDRVVARAKAHGLTVILDRHRPTSDAQSPLWFTERVSEADWINDWRTLARRYADDPTVIGVDLHNEPRGAACWGCGDPDRDWAAAATRAGNAVLAENPRLLVIIEGIEQPSNGSSSWWGGDLSDARAQPIELAVADRVVYSPHDYPASIYPQQWFADPAYPANLPAHWDRSWGYLVTEGIAPVLLGEFGTKLETTSDRQWLTTLVDYLQTNSISFAYWSFNPNSGDTGGLVQDDWRTPQRAKLEALRPLLGEPTPTTPPPAAPPPAAPRSTAPPSTAPPPAAPAPTTPPPTPPSSAAPPSADPSQSTGTSAEWRVTSAWSGGYVAEITVRSVAGRNGWTLTYDDPAAISVVNAWGMTCRVQSAGLVCVGTDWAREIPAGGERTVGLQVSTRSAPPTDPSLTLR